MAGTQVALLPVPPISARREENRRLCPLMTLSSEDGYFGWGES